MKKEKPRDLALKSLNNLDGKNHYSGDYIDHLFRNHPHLNSRDRAFINQLIQGVVRWKLRLDWVIGQFSSLPTKKIEPQILNILRLSLYQILFLDRTPNSAAVNEAVNQAKKIRRGAHIVPFVNGILRNICRQKNEIKYPDRYDDSLKYLSIYYSYPEWLLKKWIKELGGKETEELIEAQNQFQGLNLRTNSIKLSRDELVEKLLREGIGSVPLTYAPEGLRLEKFRGRIDRLIAFNQGLFQVQHEAAQIVSYLLAPEPYSSVLDICAGYGGKSTHLAVLMSGKGNVFALDINIGRLINLYNSTKRLGIENVRVLAADAVKPLSNLFRSEFDRIMVDAPCSGLGVISRNPDIKWNRTQEDIVQLARLQKAILDNAVSVLKKQGRMLYVTCTISREENEEVVEKFLSDNRCMLLEDLSHHIPEWGRDLINEQGFFRTLPHVHAMDGFFAALFSKKTG
jgi:16S rRNA (cytosine967-C5)-methyltransferase